MEQSQKQSERSRRSEVQPTDVANVSLESTMSVDLESSWPSPSNKYQLQLSQGNIFSINH